MVTKGAPPVPLLPSDPGLRTDTCSVLSAQGVFMNMRKYSHTLKIVTLK